MNASEATMTIDSGSESSTLRYANEFYLRVLLAQIAEDRARLDEIEGFARAGQQ